MTKKICCVALICFILGCNFCLTAFAVGEDILIGFAIDWLIDSYVDVTGVDTDPDALIDYYNTPEGFARLQTVINALGGGLVDAYVTANLNDAVDARYRVAQLQRDQLNALYDMLQDYWSNDSANVRNMSLGDIGITVADGVSVHGAFGNIAGSGPAALRNSDNSYNTNSYIRFAIPDNFSPASNTLYVYNGNRYYPPVLYVSTNNTVYHGTAPLYKGYYYVLNDSQLLYADVSVMGMQSFGTVYTTDSTGYVTDMYPHVYLPSGGGTNKSYRVYNINSTTAIYLKRDSAVGYYAYGEALGLYTNAVGIHIKTDDTVLPKDITPPNDIPYDDDGTVMVLLPVDEPSAPVYMSPTVYNNYYNNGDIVDSHDTTNNYLTDDQIQQIINNYNNYKSEYDDNKILGKLDVVIGKLNDIYNAVKDLDRLDEVFDAVPIYDNFSDCITTNVPLIADIQNLVDTMRVDEASSGFDDVFYNASGVMHPSGVSSGYDNLIPTLYDGFSPNVGWYAPYRNDIRNLLKLFCYAGGIVAVWYAVRSVFGVHGGGDDG